MTKKTYSTPSTVEHGSTIAITLGAGNNLYEGGSKFG